MKLPVCCNEMVEHVALFQPNLLLAPCCFSPTLVGINQRRYGEWLWGVALLQDFPGTTVAYWRRPLFGGKHEEAQAYAIGRTGRLLIHQSHIIHRRCSQTVLDLQDNERQAEEGYE